MSPSVDVIATLCPVCGTPFERVRRQRFCSEQCRKTAWARTNRTVKPPEPQPLPGTRRSVTVYQCPECESVELGEQWCRDCNRPRTKLGIGGLCPHCSEPVAVSDLIQTSEPTQSPM